MNRRNTQLDRIIGKAESLRGYLDATLAQLQRLERLADSMPTGSDAPKVTGGGNELTKVEAAAQHRMKVSDERSYLLSLIDAAEHGLSLAADECRRILGSRIDVPRCDSTGRDGAIEWADPTCHSVPSRGPLCDRCAKREYRWRNRNGLPLRTDGLFTGDAA